MKNISLLYLLCFFSSFASAGIPDTSLVAYYPFDGNADDYSIYQNHGSVNGAILIEDQFGNPNSAYYFDGNDYIRIEDDNSIDFTNNFTLAAWIIPTNDNNKINEVIGKGRMVNGSGYGLNLRWDIYNDSTTIAFQNHDGVGGHSLHSVGKIPLNSWVHVACTYDGSIGRIYINGVLDTEGALNYTLLNSTRPLYIGSEELGLDRLFNGGIDEVRLYNRALSSAEVFKLTSDDVSIYTDDGSLTEDRVLDGQGNLYDLVFDSLDQFRLSANEIDFQLNGGYNIDLLGNYKNSSQGTTEFISTGDHYIRSINGNLRQEADSVLVSGALQVKNYGDSIYHSPGSANIKTILAADENGNVVETTIADILLLSGYKSSIWTVNSNSSVFYNAGAVSLGTSDPKDGMLTVAGKIISKEIEVYPNGQWPDYVFDSSYKMLTLKELEDYIKREKHLPKIPTQEDVTKEGVKVGEMNKLLLEKIEELTLHILDLNKRIMLLEKKD